MEKQGVNLAIDIEQNKIAETIGVQDQCASAFGGFIHIDADKEGVKLEDFLSGKSIKNILNHLIDGIYRKAKIFICRF